MTNIIYYLSGKYMNIDKKFKQLYPHISFEAKWSLSNNTIYTLGQCNAIIQAISETPILPNYRKKSLEV